jgi:hypothetical protein
MIMQRLAKMFGVVTLLVLAGASIGSATPRPVPEAPPKAQPMRPSCEACADGVNSCIEDGIAPETCRKAYERCFANCVRGNFVGSGAGEDHSVSDGKEGGDHSDGEPGSNASSR